jgi:FkbM family methyltransferase
MRRSSFMGTDVAISASKKLSVLCFCVVIHDLLVFASLRVGNFVPLHFVRLFLGGRAIVFRQWSQFEEDLILASGLSSVVVGFYIDVGANDPFVHSVTNHFYERGWRGINVEPLRDAFAKLQRSRPGDINLNIGCSAKSGNFHLLQDGRLSRVVPLRVPGTVPIEIVPLGDVWDAHVPRGAPVHFCKIDVEGSERDVILGLDLTKHRPWTFCVECTRPRSVTPTWDTWEPILIAAGYRLACHHVINRFYYDARNHPELASAWTTFSAPWKVVSLGHGRRGPWRRQWDNGTGPDSCCQKMFHLLPIGCF